LIIISSNVFLNWWICDLNLESGTTWTSELLWLLMNNCDTEKAKETPLFVRAPFTEYTRQIIFYSII
jgi:hypothetical protein